MNDKFVNDNQLPSQAYRRWFNILVVSWGQDYACKFSESVYNSLTAEEFDVITNKNADIVVIDNIVEKYS